MKAKFSLKILPAAVLLAAPWVANASLDALSVQSKLGEPFSATVALSGNEAQTALKNPGSVSISGASHLKGRVVERNNTPVIVISSTSPVRDPITSFTVKVGSTSRQYSALLDPPAAPSAPVALKAPTKITPTQIIAAAEAEGPVASGDIRLGHHYTTQQNDTVISIARRIKTPNVTLGQTMRAIIAKNPHAFRNGNPNALMSGVNIRIPTADELARPAAVRVTKKPAHIVKSKVNAEKTETQTQTTTPSAETPEQTEKPIITTHPTVSEPAAAVSEPVVAASESVTASEPISAPASEVAASETAASETIVTPPVVQEVPKAPAQQTPAEESGINWMTWLPYLAGGLLLLLLLALLLKKRGKDVSAPKTPRIAKDKEFVPTSDEFDIPSVAAIPAAAAPTVAKAEELETLDDEDITFDIVAPSASTKPTEPPAPPPVHHAAADIPVLTEVASDDTVVFDDLPDLDLSKAKKPDSFMEAESFIDEAAVHEIEKPQTVEKHDTTEDIPLFEFEELEPPKAKPVADTHDQAFDFDFNVDDHTDHTSQIESSGVAQFMEEEAEVPAPTPRRAPSVEDQLADGEKQKLAFDPSLDFDLALEGTPVAPAVQQHTATDFAFDLGEVAETVKPEVVPPAFEPDYHIDLEPAPAAPAAPVLESEITFDDTPEEAVIPVKTEAKPAVEHPVEVDEPLEFSFTEPASAPTPAPSVATFEIPVEKQPIPAAPVTSAITLETPAEPVVPAVVPATAPTAPVSDNAPLQAKLELVKMYLAMDDTEGAAETLYDLMDNCEDNDAIYQEAEALLATLPQA